MNAAQSDEYLCPEAEDQLAAMARIEKAVASTYIKHRPPTLAEKMARDRAAMPQLQEAADRMGKPASAWQPIETAPRDGTAVLGYRPGRPGYFARQDCKPIHWVGGKDGEWQDGHGYGHGGWVFTHWMPLPEPPV